MNKTKTEEKRPKQKIVWSVLDSWRLSLSLSLSLSPPPHLCARLRSRVCGCVRARACMCVCACARSRLKLLFFIHLRCFFSEEFSRTQYREQTKKEEKEKHNKRVSFSSQTSGEKSMAALFWLRSETAFIQWDFPFIVLVTPLFALGGVKGWLMIDLKWSC